MNCATITVVIRASAMPTINSTSVKPACRVCGCLSVSMVSARRADEGGGDVLVVAVGGRGPAHGDAHLTGGGVHDIDRCRAFGQAVGDLVLPFAAPGVAVTGVVAAQVGGVGPHHADELVGQVGGVGS